MTNQCHILNGDALKEQFPASISGDLIVLRECLVDGDVSGSTLEELFQSRATFISENVPDCSRQDYLNSTVPEISKLLSIPENTKINLWFEEDLFCQVNFWFSVHTLEQAGKSKNLYLVHPEEPNQYGFGYCSTAELEQFYKNKTAIKKPALIAKLWENYQADDLDGLINIAEQLEQQYPFVKAAVQAHIDRSPGAEETGVPFKTLKTIIDEVDTTDFTLIFKEFNKRLPIYGLGDLQVERILRKIKKCL